MILSQNFFELESSPVEGHSLQQKEKKGGERKGENKIKKSKPLRCNRRSLS